MTENKSNQTKAVELETKIWTKFVFIGSHFSGGAETWWRDNYLFIKTIIYSGEKPKLNFILSKSHHQRKQEKKYLIDIIKNVFGILIYIYIKSIKMGGNQTALNIRIPYLPGKKR